MVVTLIFFIQLRNILTQQRQSKNKKSLRAFVRIFIGITTQYIIKVGDTTEVGTDGYILNRTPVIPSSIRFIPWTGVLFPVDIVRG